MQLKKLTKKEQNTVWGLVNHPNLNDKALAKKTRLKLSTVTAIRRRLREKDYYWTVNIPNFYHLGYELLSVEYGPFNEAIPVDIRTNYFKNFTKNNPNTVFSMMSRTNGIVFNISRNYAEANTLFEDLELFFTEHHLTDEAGWKRVIFPFQTAVFWNFFDFSPVIRYVYDIKRKIKYNEYSKDKVPKVMRLSKKEKKVIYGLVKYPEESDNSLAERFNISRQAVSNIKKRLLREELLTTRRILNLKHSGCSLIMFSFTFFGTRAPIKTRRNGLEYAKGNVPAFLGVSSNFENIMMAAIKNYPEYDKLREKMLSFYKTHLSLARQPDVLLFPVEDICYYKTPTFHLLLEEMLNIDE